MAVAGIPYSWQSSANLSRYESWYASLLYMSFRTCEADIRVEEASSHGRSDMVLLHGGQVFVMKFKVAEGEGESEAALDQAMTQIREKRYDEKYRNLNHPIHCMALVFGKTERNLLTIRAESNTVYRR